MKRFSSLLPLCAGILASTTLMADVINIDAARLNELRAANVPVVDIRTSPEWTETGVLPGSHLVTYFNEDGESDPAKFMAHLKTIAAVDEPVVLICRSGRRTEAASEVLVRLGGYQTVYNVEEGLKGWVEQGGALYPALP